MKVGIDGVLLGAWTDVTNAESILDVGTGSGLIALMLAQRSEATVTAIDIDADAVIQANENIENSVWRSKISATQITLQELAQNTGTKFDLIVSNPPFL